MRNTLTIFRREFATYFNSPIGYIYIIVFLLINTALFITPFFAYPRADMRQMFNMLPVFLCVLIPLITMRLWSEERKENTIEMLLTFPMKPHELVVGKFLASFVFFAIALAGTAPIPIMLEYLGEPDWGIIFTSYLGTLLMGGFFLAVGTFLSSLVRDQIIAAVMSLAGCFTLYLVGTNFIATFLDGWWGGLGSGLKNVLGVLPHYETFNRGIIAFADLAYFIIWGVLFLFLNGLFLEGRNRRGATTNFSFALLICFGIGVMFNVLVGDLYWGRSDWTEGKIHTVSQVSKEILQKLKIPVQVNYYVTPRSEMPTQFQNLEQDVIDKLHEMKVNSNGKLQYKIIHLHAKKLLEGVRAVRQGLQKDEKAEKRDKSVEESLLEKGIQPFSVNIIEDDKQKTQLVYSAIGIAYKEKKEEILPQLVSQNLHELEYQIVNTAYRKTRDKKPVIALVAPKEAYVIPEYMRQWMQRSGQKIPQTQDPFKSVVSLLSREGYEVKRVALTKKQPLPKEYDTLVVLNPREFNERQKWELARALRSGKNVFLAVQNYTFNYSVQRNQLSIQKSEEKPQINDLLKNYGITVDKDALMDINSVTLTVPGDPNSVLPIPVPVQLPTHIMITSQNMNRKNSITERLQSVPYIWGTALAIDKEKIKENKFEVTKLFSSSPKAWKVPVSRTFTNSDFEPPVSGGEQYPLMVMLQGQFPDPFVGKKRPAWPKPKPDPRRPMPQPKDEKEAPATEIEEKPGKLLLIGCAQAFRNQLLRNSMGLFMNCVDKLSLEVDLTKIRSRAISERLIDRPSDNARVFWKVLHFGLIPVLLVAMGIGRLTWRRMRRDRYSLNVQKEQA